MTPMLNEACGQTRKACQRPPPGPPDVPTQNQPLYGPERGQADDHGHDHRGPAGDGQQQPSRPGDKSAHDQPLSHRNP